MDKSLAGHGHARYDKRGKELPRSLRYTRPQRATEEQVMRIALAFSDHERALEGGKWEITIKKSTFMCVHASRPLSIPSSSKHSSKCSCPCL